MHERIIKYEDRKAYGAILLWSVLITLLLAISIKLVKGV